MRTIKSPRCLIKKDEYRWCYKKENKYKQIFPEKYEPDCVMTNIGPRTMEHGLAVTLGD